MSSNVTTAPTPPVAPPPAAAVPPPAPLAAGPAFVVGGRLHIPPGLNDLEAFRRWARSEECPEKLRVSYLAGTLWVDLVMEQYFTHNQVKAEVARVLGNLTRESRQGRFSPDGMLLSNPAANLSTIPDGSFISFAALESGRVRLVSGKIIGAVELEGAPEMILEVVSDSSVEKDLELLPPLYWMAGIPEYWRIDARGAEPHFEILRRDPQGYVAASEAERWWRSAVFSRSFRLTQELDALGLPLFTLEVRS